MVMNFMIFAAGMAVGGVLMFFLLLALHCSLSEEEYLARLEDDLGGDTRAFGFSRFDGRNGNGYQPIGGPAVKPSNPPGSG